MTSQENNSSDRRIRSGSKLVPTISRNKKMDVTTLQFLVGVLVTLGGAAFATFAYNSFGRSLRLAHLSIGLIALAGGFIALSTKSW